MNYNLLEIEFLDVYEQLSCLWSLDIVWDNPQTIMIEYLSKRLYEN